MPTPTSSHVITIVMENKEYGSIIGDADAPYVNRLAARYGLATNSYGVRHPSLPDYLALTSGSTHGIDSDCTDCHVDARNVVDQLEAARFTWKAYMEDMPKRKSATWPCSSAGSSSSAWPSGSQLDGWPSRACGAPGSALRPDT